MADITTTSQDAGSRPYVPFPTFPKWSASLIDLTTIDSYEREFNRAKESAGAERARILVESTARIAAVETGAIEGLYTVDRGFTMTIATTTAQWQSLADARGDNVRRSIEDALESYGYVLDLATGSSPITQKHIRELHEIALRTAETYRVLTASGWSDRPLPKGEYKTYPNNPVRPSGSVHVYCPPADVQIEMQRLVDEMQTADFLAAHPVAQASYAHYAFVAIHPFADGNGRVARALSSVFLYRRPGVPLVVWADQRDAYIAALELADRANYGVLTQFFARCLIDTLDLLAVQLGSGDQSSLADSSGALRNLLTAQSGLSYVQIDALAGRIIDETLSAAVTSVQRIEPIGPTFRSAASMRSGQVAAPPDGYRQVESSLRFVHVDLINDPPGQAQTACEFAVYVALDVATEPAFRLVNSTTGAQLRIRTDEVHPSPGSAFLAKLDVFIGAQIARLMTQFNAAVRQALLDARYITE